MCGRISIHVARCIHFCGILQNMQMLLEVQTAGFLWKTKIIDGLLTLSGGIDFAPNYSPQSQTLAYTSSALSPLFKFEHKRVHYSTKENHPYPGDRYPTRKSTRTKPGTWPAMHSILRLFGSGVDFIFFSNFHVRGKDDSCNITKPCTRCHAHSLISTQNLKVDHSVATQIHRHINSCDQKICFRHGKHPSLTLT